MSHLEASLRRLEAHVRANEEDASRNRPSNAHKAHMRLLEGHPAVRQIMPSQAAHKQWMDSLGLSPRPHGVKERADPSRFSELTPRGMPTGPVYKIRAPTLSGPARAAGSSRVRRAARAALGAEARRPPVTKV